MFSVTVSHGNNPCSWNTTEGLLRVVMLPRGWFSRPATRRSNVDLPQPDGPSTHTNSPSAMSREISSSTIRIPLVLSEWGYAIHRSRTETAALGTSVLLREFFDGLLAQVVAVDIFHARIAFVLQ